MKYKIHDPVAIAIDSRIEFGVIREICTKIKPSGFHDPFDVDAPL